jgi:hypothetical protein
MLRIGGGKKGGGKCLSLLLSKCESRAEHFECQHLKKQPKKGGLYDINIKLRIRSGIDRKMDIERKNETIFIFLMTETIWKNLTFLNK